MTRRCLDCNDAPQETMRGLCEDCKAARIEQARADIAAKRREEKSGDGDDDGQTGLDDW